MKAEQAIREALEMLAAHGIQSGDVYENLERTLEAVKLAREALEGALATWTGSRTTCEQNILDAREALEALNDAGGVEEARRRGN